jgi:DNA-binding winged helix-turn-helix (wHTH) protein/Tol biopolymer transport system component
MQPSPATPRTVHFGLFEVDLSAAELRKHGRKVPLQDQPFTVLALLLRCPGELVTREELQRALWPDDTFGDFDEGLNKAIQKLRQALDDSTDSPRFIETLPRKGYRFIAAVEARSQPTTAFATDGAGKSVPAIPVRRREVLAWALFAIASVALGVVAGISFRRHPSETHAVRFQIPLPAEAEYVGRVQISPNGRYVLVSGGGADFQGHLWVHSLDSTTTRLLPTNDSPFYPFWSPNSRFVAYFDDRNHLKKIDVTGGVSQEICDPGAKWIGGGAWSRDGTILFSKSGGAKEHNSMFRVSASGGKISAVLPLDESRHEVNQTFPRFLPDGRHFLYQSFYGTVKATDRVDQASSTLSTGIFLASLDSKETRMLVASDSNAEYAPPGFLVYGEGGTLVAQPFDLNRLRVTGDPIPVAEHVQRVQDQTSLFSAASDHEVVVFRREEQALIQLAWYKRDGARLGSIGEPVRTFTRTLSLSPDEKRVAWHRISPETDKEDLWTGELATGIFTRLTAGADEDYAPVWSPDGHEVVFSSDRQTSLIGGGLDLYRKSAGGGEQQLMFKSAECKMPRQWLSDGSVLFEIWGDGHQGDFYLLPPSGSPKPVLLLKDDFVHNLPIVSSDRRWIAYDSDESGRLEVYVAAFPTFKEKRRVSDLGGCQPRWRKDGNELFYITLDGKMMSVDVRRGATLEAGSPKVLFQVPFQVVGRGWMQYVVTGDGTKFIFPEHVERNGSLNVVSNWAAGLNR